MSLHDTVHRCSLRLIDTKPALLPLGPGSGWYQKFSRAMKKLTVLNENDMKCRNFLKTGAALRIEKRRHASSKYWYIIHPFSKLNRIIEITFFITLVHRWIFFMDNIEEPDKYLRTAIARDIVHTIIMISFFFTGYVKHTTKEIYIHPKDTIRHYFVTYFFIDLFLLIEENRVRTIGHLLKLLNLINWRDTIIATVIFVSLVLTTIRFVSVQNVITNSVEYFGLGTAASFIIKHVCTFIFILHFFTFLLFVIPFNMYVTNQRVPPDSWISQRKLTIDKYTANTYAESFLIVISYFFGSNYIITIKQPYEQLLLFLCTFTGRIYILFVIGTILTKFGSSDKADTEYDNIITQFNSYMTAQHVPSDIKDQVIERFEYSYQRKFFNVEQMMTILTERLKTELFLFGAKQLISSNKFLKSLNVSDLCWLFSHMKTAVVGKTETVVDYMHYVNSIYFVLSGTLAAYYKDLEIFHVKDGDVFGVIILFKNEASPYNVIAIETSEIYYVKKKWLDILLEKHPEAFKYFKTIYAERMKKFHDVRMKREAGEDGRELLRKGLLLEKLKRRETEEFEYNN
ncbi:potassium voltage-gated channel subfamily H member 6-like [Diorhabda carinulata]|uniref:potassium voltage-gated channel subfamily H member 6-like n=1 Tax=Diorhabda carinulata TaxID=1163345 RepID=UPI0025A1636B|nr:potassium voltage-gated channel subfamily H member 6-like [Diorhabda carinulata]